MPALSIGGRHIGAGHPCFVIAEVGLNHNGDLDLARRIIDVAVDAGADAVKFQKRTVDTLAIGSVLDAPAPRLAPPAVILPGITVSMLLPMPLI